MLMIGFVARVLLLGNTLIIGAFANKLCHEQQLSYCGTVPAWLSPMDGVQIFYLVLAIVIVGGILNVSFTAGIAATGTRVAELFHNEAIYRVSRAPQRFFDQNPVGRIYTRFASDFQNLLIAVGPHAGQTAIILFDLIIMTTLVIVADWRYLPLLVLTGMLNYSVYRFNHNLVRDERRETALQRTPTIAKFSETVQGGLSIRIYDRVHRFIEVFRDSLENYLRQRSRADIAFFSFGLQMSVVTSFLVFLTGCMGVWLIQVGAAGVGEVAVVLTYVTLASAMMQRLFVLITSVEQGLTGAERLNEYLRMGIEPFSSLPQKATFPTGHRTFAKDQAAKTGKALQVDDLWFRYSEGERWILRGLSFAVPAGESLGIIGRTGAGKTSIYQALLHLYPVSRGQVVVGGRSLALGEGGIQQWRNQFSLVSQQPTIFRGTLRANLTPEARPDDSRLLAVLRAVGLREFASEAGLGFFVEENGDNLSAGQKQMVAIARALLSPAEIVLMDEATSSIDPESEIAFMRATRDQLATKTRLIIAHRLETVIECDHVLWLDQGQVRAIGRPEVITRQFKSHIVH
jgi:ABC-type multidrug transport system fused ATPase/permease subunit